MVAGKIAYGDVLVAGLVGRGDDPLRPLFDGHGRIVGAVVHQHRHGEGFQIPVGIKVGIGQIEWRVVQRHQFGQVFDHGLGRAGLMRIGADSHGHLLTSIEHRCGCKYGKGNVLSFRG